ncbi:hypothetical protein OIU84_000953 [Salix udensis]|uniref:Phytocyanin domain-containing protein n=1 Tax=Salix udensis TaxID=889485 RepID=A0AAD6L5W3_9ROSI|nr:hypothetical protein OIU84_000953 [Salix udensis]
MAGRLSFTVGFLIVASVGLLHGACAASSYTVGDDLGWTVPPNSSYYEEWASQKTFQIGDSIVFNSTTGNHTATEVDTREEYDYCTKTGSIVKVPQRVGASYKRNFDANGTLYFLCSEGTDCEQGQKMIVKVGDGIAPSFAAPSLAGFAAPSFAAPSLAAAAAASALFFSTLAIYFLN